MNMSPCVDYWEDVLLHLPTQRSILFFGFWPFSNWKLNYVKIELSFTRLVIDLENLVNYPYCGPKNFKSTPACTTPCLKILTMEILFL